MTEENCVMCRVLRLSSLCQSKIRAFFWVFISGTRYFWIFKHYRVSSSAKNSKLNKETKELQKRSFPQSIFTKSDSLINKGRSEEGQQKGNMFGMLIYLFLSPVQASKKTSLVHEPCPKQDTFPFTEPLMVPLTYTVHCTLPFTGPFTIRSTFHSILHSILHGILHDVLQCIILQGIIHGILHSTLHRDLPACDVHDHH